MDGGEDQIELEGDWVGRYRYLLYCIVGGIIVNLSMITEVIDHTYQPSD